MTDAGYLTMAVRPRIRRLYRVWARRRYGRLAPAYGKWVRQNPAYLAPLHSLLPRLPASPQLIIEVGAGTGVATSVLTATFPAARVLAVDSSEAMLAGLHPRPGNVDVVVADAAALPVPDGTADLVVAHNAPFHMAEMRRVAGPAGVIAVVLSSAGRIPAPLRRGLVRRLTTPDWPSVEEYRGGDGVALLLRRAGIPRAGAR